LTEIPEELVVAFVDGHLTSSERAEFETRLKNDPALSERVASHRWIAQQIVAAYGSPPTDEVDDALVARLGLASPNVIAFTDRTSLARRASIFRAALAATAMAASLVVGLFIGRSTLPPATLLQTDRNGHLVAGGALALGLSDSLAGQPGPIRIGITFRTSDGYCRTFNTSHGVSGLACRNGDQWRVPMIASDNSVAGASDAYRLAGGGVAPSVMAEVDQRILGEPLSLSEESELKANHWH
jgi:hypothetical protein